MIIDVTKLGKLILRIVLARTEGKVSVRDTDRSVRTTPTERPSGQVRLVSPNASYCSLQCSNIS
jgi:hypothetical protein